MSDILQLAFDIASQLPPQEQDLFGARFLAELESELRWNELFASSPELLEKLAAEAIAEYKAGLTLPLDSNARFSHK